MTACAVFSIRCVVSILTILGHFRSPWGAFHILVRTGVVIVGNVSAITTSGYLPKFGRIYGASDCFAPYTEWEVIAVIEVHVHYSQEGPARQNSRASQTDRESRKPDGRRPPHVSAPPMTPSRIIQN